MTTTCSNCGRHANEGCAYERFCLDCEKAYNLGLAHSSAAAYRAALKAAGEVARKQRSEFLGDLGELILALPVPEKWGKA